VTDDTAKTSAAADDKAPAKPTAHKRPQAKSARRRSRELALQGLYQWLVSAEDASVIGAHMQEQDGFDKCDRAHFDALLRGGIEQAGALDAVLLQHIDRKAEHLSPVEHAALMIGTYELMHCLDVPYRVAINEAVELAKTFGGTDGHKYVNGVLDKASTQLRPNEARGGRARP
jgi:transcription antitermination protein NusB